MFDRSRYWFWVSPIAKAYLRPTYHRFLRSLNSPFESQSQTLRRLCQLTANTEYGQSFGLSIDDSYEAFAKKIPIVDYQDLQPWINRQQKSNTSILTPNKVLFYEPTSGSSGLQKQIPYNSELLSAFTQLFHIWSYDILKTIGSLKSGQFYFSVTPIPDHQGTADTSDQLPDDASYVQGPMQWILRKLAAVPSEVKYLKNRDHFFHVLACYLCLAEKLEMVSVWNPSFFLQILEYISANRQEIVRSLRSHEYTVGGRSFYWLMISNHRADQILGAKSSSELWPMLRFISCWDRQHALRPAERLREIFPRVWIQGKGLLATEAPITVPIASANGEYPMIENIFFEFIDDDGRIKRIHELEQGQRYELIISQPAGLLRYRIGDQIRVQFHSSIACPALIFEGRATPIVDLVGEKLHESVAQQSLAVSGFDFNTFAQFVPYFEGHGKAGYLLLLEEGVSIDQKKLNEVLYQSHHYALARKLHQLSDLIVVPIKNVEAFFIDCAQQIGIKRGDMKPSLLLRNVDLGCHIAKSLPPDGLGILASNP